MLPTSAPKAEPSHDLPDGNQTLVRIIRLDRKGIKVIDTEHPAPRLSTLTGSLAQLGAFFRIGSGSGALIDGTLKVLLSSILLGFALLFSASPAMAAQAHVFKSVFGSAGYGDGQFTGNAGVAVDNSTGPSKGDVYVADAGNHRVEKFGPSGNFLLAFGANVGGAGVDTCTSGCVAGTSGSGPGAFEAPTFVAVDSSASGGGDVYVGDTADHTVSKFDSSGNLIASWQSGGQLVLENELDGIAVSPSGTLYVLRRHEMLEFEANGTSVAEFEATYETEPEGIAVDSTGDIYKARGERAVAKLDPSGSPLIETVDSGPATSLAVQPITDEVYVAHSGFISRYDSSGTAQETSFGSSHITSADGIAVTASGRVYVSDSGASAVETFEPEVVPNVTTGSASAITKTTATVSGHVEPAEAGEEVIGCRVEYGTNTSYGMEAPCSPATPYSEPKAVTAALTGLSASTEYSYRVVAENAGGFDAYGPNGTFNTPLRPSLGAISAPVVLETTATFSALINPESSETEYHFEYATSPTGPFVSTSMQTLPFEDNESHLVEAEVSGLQPDTIYYLRLSATNEVGTTVEPQPANQGSYAFETLGPPAAETYLVHSIHVAKETPKEPAPQGTFILFGNVTAHGFTTKYHFEYVSQEKFEHDEFAEAGSTAEEEGSGFVAGDLPALEPGKTYHYRLTVTNGADGNPVVHGNEQILKSPIPGEQEAGEEENQPSPCPNEVLRGGPSASLPDCRAYEQITPVNKEGTQDNWAYGATETNVTPGLDGEHVAISTLSRFGKNDNSGADTVYLFSRTPSGWQMTSTAPQPESGGDRIVPGGFSGETDFFTPDLSNFLLARGFETTAAHQSPEAEFLSGPAGGPYAVAATAPRSDETVWMAQSRDGSTAVLKSEDHELAGVPTGTTQGSDLYEWRTGQLHQLNVLGEDTPIGTCGAHIVHGWEGEGQGTELGQSFIEVSSINAVSRDGSRVFFEAVPGTNCGEPSHLYMRLNGDETRDLGTYAFRGANPEGTKLFLSRGECNPSCGAVEFFSYDTETETLKHLFNVGGIGYSSRVLSENGNVFYFNNYNRYEISTETMTFVDYAAYNGGGYGGYYTSPDGNDLYFSSEGVAGVPGGEGVQSYRYDATENLIQCMSCASSFNPEPKLGNQIMEGDSASLQKPSPLAMPASANGNFAFFSAQSELVSNDIDGEISETLGGNATTPSSDVYEWRRNGVDGCAEIQGCLALITNGIDGRKNEFLGTTPSGRDVFIATHSQLVPTDTDNSGDLYDARIDGGFPPPPPPAVQCEGDACHNPPNSPNPPNLSSSTYNGPGNEHFAEPKERKKPKKHHKHHRAKKKGHKRSHRRAAGHHRGGAK